MLKYKDFINKGIVLFLFCSVVIALGESHGQRRSKADNSPVTYEELYDAPYELNKLFIHFQPIYGEFWTANINAGFGMEATYMWDDKFTFNVQARKPYSQSFDLSRDQAVKTGRQDNTPNIYNYFQIGATYHIKDFETESETKMYLYRKSYKGDKWAARVPRVAKIPSKLRKIYGARLGGMFYDATTNLNRVMEKQGVGFDQIKDPNGATLPPTYTDADGREQENLIYGNFDVKGIYAGASMTWIRNVAVDFDNKYQAGVDDLILTAYFDVLFAPSVTLQDIIYTEDGLNGGAPITRTYSTEPIDLSKVGFRLGLEGKFNRELSWGYNGEIGYRPGVKNRGFYAALKFSFPIYSTGLKYEVEAFGK